jgi:hypothetical protein
LAKRERSGERIWLIIITNIKHSFLGKIPRGDFYGQKTSATAANPRRPATKLPEPPVPLGEPGRRLWDQIMGECNLTDLGCELLLEACQARDRAESLRVQIDASGEMLQTARGLKENPLLKLELQTKAFVTRTLHKLAISEPTRPVGRARGGVGWRPDT